MNETSEDILAKLSTTGVPSRNLVGVFLKELMPEIAMGEEESVGVPTLKLSSSIYREVVQNISSLRDSQIEILRDVGMWLVVSGSRYSHPWNLEISDLTIFPPTRDEDSYISTMVKAESQLRLIYTNKELRRALNDIFVDIVDNAAFHDFRSTIHYREVTFPLSYSSVATIKEYVKDLSNSDNISVVSTVLCYMGVIPEVTADSMIYLKSQTSLERDSILLAMLLAHLEDEEDE